MQDPQALLDSAKALVADKVPSLELYVRVGVDLAQKVNGLKSLSGSEKQKLVVQTVLKMLDDGETADIKRVEESTETEKTKALEAVKAKWAGLKNLVSAQLPLTLDLVVSAARGSFDLRKSASPLFRLLASLARLPFFVSCCGAQVASAVAGYSEQAAQILATPEPDAGKEPPKVSETQEAQVVSPGVPAPEEPSKES